MEFAVLDQVIARFSSVYDRAVQTRRPVEAEWFAEQIASLRQVRELILSRFGDQTPPTAGP